MMKKVSYLIYVLLLFTVVGSSAKGNIKEACVTQHLGSIIPLNLNFVDAAGNKVILKNLIRRPTIIDFCYYRCTGICTPLMVELADVITRSNLRPGADYNVISVSISPTETPAMAMQKKNTLLMLMNKNVPKDSWRFLTGDSINIKLFADAAGFHFIKQDNTYLHKGVLIFVDRNGKICYYLQPGFTARGDFSILPSEFEMAVLETSKGKAIASITKILQTCFTFRPNSKAVFIFGLIFIVSIITILTVLLIIKKTKLPNAAEIINRN